MRKAAKKPRQTPYAASTPTASDANTAHTNIIESITENFLCFRRQNCARTGVGDVAYPHLFLQEFRRSERWPRRFSRNHRCFLRYAVSPIESVRSIAPPHLRLPECRILEAWPIRCRA